MPSECLLNRGQAVHFLSKCIVPLNQAHGVFPLEEFDDIGSHGTKIIIYNLWLNDVGKMELDFDADPQDIRISGGIRKVESLPAWKSVNEQHIANQLHILFGYMTSNLNESTWSEVTFQNKSCKCGKRGKRVAVRISESSRNKHKLYCNYEDKICDLFSWCLPTSDVPYSITKAPPAIREDDMRNVKYLLEHLKDKFKNTNVNGLRHNVYHLNVLLLFVCLLFIILFGLLVQRK
ncbi:uncharacterized protein LOC115666993 [Syzygium oleosum]|uniref:uncharacterized protein LOC115666993 n=1 Tax=Syzygium oleosum TaxID=219896 RepID=UPI0024BB6F74|nr:uncharacterized protein LOC115666993 [Syzygium oleosum]